MSDITITREDDEFIVSQEDKNTGHLTFHEMIGQVISLTLIDKVRNGPLHAMETEQGWKDRRAIWQKRIDNRTSSQKEMSE